MNIKLFTNDKETINFIKTNTQYYNIKNECIEKYNENGDIVALCIILYDIKSVDYDIKGTMQGTIQPIINIYYQNISLTMRIKAFNEIFIEKGGK